MKYMLLCYLNQAEFDSRTDPKTRDAFWGSFMPYVHSIKQAGIFAGGAGLEPPETVARERVGNLVGIPLLPGDLEPRHHAGVLV